MVHVVGGSGVWSTWLEVVVCVVHAVGGLCA